jgi:succinyl-CoA synthetase beta subunit
MESIDIMKFSCGSRLVTDGYDIVFVTKNGDAYAAAQNGQPNTGQPVRESFTKWIKATDQSVVFVNVCGDACVLAFDDTKVPRGIEITLEDLYNKTTETSTPINMHGDNFVKFKGTRTILFATEDSLYAKLASNGKAYRIV